VKNGTLGGGDVLADQLDQRGQAGGAGADPIGQGGTVRNFVRGWAGKLFNPWPL